MKYCSSCDQLLFIFVFDTLENEKIVCHFNMLERFIKYDFLIVRNELFELFMLLFTIYYLSVHFDFSYYSGTASRRSQ